MMQIMSLRMMLMAQLERALKGSGQLNSPVEYPFGSTSSSSTEVRWSAVLVLELQDKLAYRLQRSSVVTRRT